MSELSGDILVEIPDDQLPKLASMYEKQAPWAPHMVTLVHMGIRWKKSEKFRESLCFLSPNNSWETDGTIIALMKCHCNDLIVFTLEEECVNLYQGLIQTNLIDYTRRMLITTIHEKHIPTMMRVIKEKNLNISHDIPSFMYTVPPELAKNYTIECPPDVYIKKLDSSAAQQINLAWPHHYPDSENYIADFIEINGGYGVYLKDTHELAAWVIKSSFGYLGILQTAEKFKRNGYASLVVKSLAKKIAEEGYQPSVTTMVGNVAGNSMFKKLGFSNIGLYGFIVLK